MIIDCHGHLVPPPLLAEIKPQAAEFPRPPVEDGGGLGFSFAGGKPTRPVAPPLSDLRGRLKWMDEQKIERQVVGGWLDMFAYEIPVRGRHRLVAPDEQHLRRPPRRSRASCRWPPCRCRTARGRRGAGRGDGAGFPGVMIGTQPKGVGGVLDDPSLDPFWEAADEPARWCSSIRSSKAATIASMITAWPMRWAG